MCGRVSREDDGLAPETWVTQQPQARVAELMHLGERAVSTQEGHQALPTLALETGSLTPSCSKDKDSGHWEFSHDMSRAGSFRQEETRIKPPHLPDP